MHTYNLSTYLAIFLPSPRHVSIYKYIITIDTASIPALQSVSQSFHLIIIKYLQSYLHSQSTTPSVSQSVSQGSILLPFLARPWPSLLPLSYIPTYSLITYLSSSPSPSRHNSSHLPTYLSSSPSPSRQE